jgi:hypothetical protein
MLYTIIKIPTYSTETRLCQTQQGTSPTTTVNTVNGYEQDNLVMEPGKGMIFSSPPQADHTRLLSNTHEKLFLLHFTSSLVIKQTLFLQL